MSNPDLFTVAEAAVVLRIGRTTAYELVRRDFDSGGGEGLAVVRIGGRFRVPRSALERIVGGPVTCPNDHDRTAGPATVADTSPNVPSQDPRSTVELSSCSVDDQLTLPFA